MRKRRLPPRARKRLAVVVLGMVVCVVVWRLWVAHQVAPAVGIYMTGDGESFLDIRRAWHGGLRVADGRIVLNEVGAYAPTEWETGVALRGGRLFVTHVERRFDGYYNDWWHECALTLEPSSVKAGDWDVCSAVSDESAIPAFEYLMDETWGRRLDAAGLDVVFGAIVSCFIETSHPQTTPASRLPVRSFLRRVDDARLAEYVKERETLGDTERSLELATGLAEDYPDNPLLGLHHVEQVARADRPEEARRLWDEWEGRFGAETEPLLKRAARRTRKNVAMAEYRRDYPAVSHYSEMLDFDRDSMDLTRLRRWQRDTFEADRLMFSNKPLIADSERRGLGGHPYLDLSLVEMLAEAEGVQALLDQFRGNDPRALERSAVYYRLGQSCGADGGRRVIFATDVRKAATRSMTPLALNACATPDQADVVWGILQRLHDTPDQEDGERLGPTEFWGLEGRLREPWPPGGGLLTDLRITDMEFQTLRVAAAIREFALTTGRLPDGPGDLSRRFPEGLPHDVFTPTTAPASLQLVTSGSVCLVYSLGPDFDDDLGSVGGGRSRYGDTEDGDLVVRVPLEREFPFPAEGVRADNVDDLLSQFPNGLPHDIYGVRSVPTGAQLSLYDSTTTRPVIVFSHGPDRDAFGLALPQGAVPQAFIDALWVAIETDRNIDMSSLTPAELESLEVKQPFVYAPDKGICPTVMLDDWGGDPVAGVRYLEPLYDPTNGVYSAGDIFIEIPRRSSPKDPAER